VVAWGIVTACTAATTNYQTLLVARIFLGMFEAAISPSLMLIGSQWYTRSEQASRFSFWYCGLGLAQILGGIMSFAFQHLGVGGLASWRIMFITLGFVTVITGAVAAFLLPDSPISASFLSATEKVALLNHVSENRTGIEGRLFKLFQVVELLIDVQIWLMTFITILVGRFIDGLSPAFSHFLMHRRYRYLVASLPPTHLPSLSSSATLRKYQPCSTYHLELSH
jgi:MFS family permease